MARSTVKCI